MFGHIERMNNEIAPVKAKNFVSLVQREADPKKKYKDAIEKDMLARDLKKLMRKTVPCGG